MKRTTVTAIAMTICALVAVGSFAGCGNANNSSSTETTKAVETTTAAKNALVGVWKSDEAEVYYTFKEDGTGALDGTGYSMPFTYVVSGNQFDITYTGNSKPETMVYTVEGDKLSLGDKSDSPATITYTRVDAVPAATAPSAKPQTGSKLVGTWTNEEIKATFTFNEDGTGTLLLDDATMPFSFEDDGTTLTCNFGTKKGEATKYTIDGDKLTMFETENSTTVYTKK